MNRGAILALDASPRSSFSIALWHPQTKPRQSICTISPGATGHGHVECLTPKIAEFMSSEKIRFEDLSRIAVNTGPGSFCGVRTGIATARALAQAASLPVIGISHMELLASAAFQHARPDAGETVIAVLSAGHNLFLQVFAANCDTLKPLTDAASFSPDAAARQCRAFSPLLLQGNGADGLANALNELPPSLRPIWRIAAAPPDPDAIGVAMLAMHRSNPSEMPTPLYVRPPDARLPETPARPLVQQ